jgi:hypothetical protein
VNREGEVREKGVVYDAAHPERTPIMALRERRAEYRSGARLDSHSLEE